jgi:hypothetical protein
MSTNFQESTNAIKIKVAGLMVGFPIQKARQAPIEAFFLRKPTANGAAQQLHIMPGTEAIPPIKVLPNDVLPNTLRSHSLGISTWTKEPSKMPRTAAFQTEV